MSPSKIQKRASNQLSRAIAKRVYPQEVEPKNPRNYQTMIPNIQTIYTTCTSSSIVHPPTHQVENSTPTLQSDELKHGQQSLPEVLEGDEAIVGALAPLLALAVAGTTMDSEFVVSSHRTGELTYDHRLELTCWQGQGENGGSLNVLPYMFLKRWGWLMGRMHTETLQHQA